MKRGFLIITCLNIFFILLLTPFVFLQATGYTNEQNSILNIENNLNEDKIDNETKEKTTHEESDVVNTTSYPSLENVLDDKDNALHVHQVHKDSDFNYEVTSDTQIIEQGKNKYEVGYINRTCSESGELCSLGYFKDLQTGVYGYSPYTQTTFTDIYVEDDSYTLFGVAKLENRIEDKTIDFDNFSESIEESELSGDYLYAVVKVEFDMTGKVLSERDFIIAYKYNLPHIITYFDDTLYFYTKSYYNTTIIYALDNSFNLNGKYTSNDKYLVDSCDETCSNTNYLSYEYYKVIDNNLHIYFYRNYRYYDIAFDKNLNVLSEEEISKDFLEPTQLQPINVQKNLIIDYAYNNNLEAVVEKALIFKDANFYYKGIIPSYNPKEITYQKLPINNYKFVKTIAVDDIISKIVEQTELEINTYFTQILYVFENDENYYIMNIESNYPSYFENISTFQISKTKTQDILENTKIEFYEQIITFKYSNKTYYASSREFSSDKDIINDKYRIVNKEYDYIEDGGFYTIKLEEFDGNVMEFKIPAYSTIYDPSSFVYNNKIYIINNLMDSTFKQLYIFDDSGKQLDCILFDGLWKETAIITSFIDENTFTYKHSDYSDDYSNSPTYILNLEENYEK